MSNNKDFKVKNGIQPTSYQESLGSIATGSVNFEYALEYASYDSVSFSIATQATMPSGIAFNNDGTKMYMIDQGSDYVYQYTLSTAFDLSTASYDSVSFSVTAQDIFPLGIAFNNAGTKLYMVGNNGNSVYQYTLSTAFDVSTASYDSVSFSVATQDSSPSGIAFNNNGTKMYMIGYNSDSVYQYTLSTAFDLSTASYDSVSLNVTNQENTPFDVTFNNDGTKMYILGYASDSLHQYTLSTAFDLSTASYDSVSFSVNGQDTLPYGIAFNNDGTKMYILGYANGNVYQYSTGYALTTNTLDLSTGSVFEINSTSNIQVGLSNPAASGTVSQATLLLKPDPSLWDLSAATLSQSASVSANTSQPNDLTFKPDGTKMYMVDYSGREIVEYNLSTAWDISSVSYDGVFSVSTTEASPTGVAFKPDGNKMYVTGFSGDEINEYDLSTAWDVTTASHNQIFSIASEETTPLSLFFKPDGTKMYVSGNTGDDISEYSLSTAWDISTASYNQSFDVSSQGNQPTGLFFKTDGTKMYVSDNNDDEINEYNLSTAWDISTASYNQNLSVLSEDTNVTGVSFKPDGTKMYIAGSNNGAVYEYDLLSSSSPNTITYDNSIKFDGGTAPDSPLVDETDVLTFSTRDGGTSYQAIHAIDGAK